jgi:mono/diheme cytochrome c family protein
MFRSLLFLATLILAGTTMALGAHAADAGKGKQLAERHCRPCHIVVPQTSSAVAIAPPFDVIAGKYRFAADAIGHAIAGPHPKMNFAPSAAEAADIADYIATLKQ